MSDIGQIYIVDDDERAGAALADLVAVLTAWPIRSFANGMAWLGAEAHLPPGCLLLDDTMKGAGGLPLLADMQLRRSAHQVVMVSGAGSIAGAVEAMRAGACDFLEKPVVFDRLERALRIAFDRLDEASQARVRAEEAKARISRLKPREQEVMMGLVEGKPNKIIAYNLGLSVRTVELYRAALMDRLAVDSVADVLKIAFAANLLTM